ILIICWAPSRSREFSRGEAMRRTVLAVTVLLLATAYSLPLGADTGANPLDQLSWMVGGAWIGQVPDEHGKVTKVILKCEWSANHRLIKFNTAFQSGGEPVPTYDGIYGW